MPCSRINGFTTIELLVTISIVSILLLISVPCMTCLINSNKAAATTNNIVTALQFARSEAIKNKINVKYCKSSDHKTCGGKWEDGQIVIDENGKLLRIFAALNYHDKLIWNSSFNKDDYIEFTSVGFTNGQTGSFIYTPSGQEKYSRSITVSQTGRIKINS